MIPPARSHRNACWDREFIIWVNASTHTQPMAIYTVEVTARGQLIQVRLITNPAMARAQMTPNNVHPHAPRSAIRHTGVYDPAMRK